MCVNSIYQFVFNFFVTLISSCSNKFKVLYARTHNTLFFAFLVMGGSTFFCIFTYS